MDQEKIGKFIRKIRKDNNLSQKDFAIKLGVTPQAVSKWENGKNLPDMAVLKEISLEFNVNIDDIINGEFNDYSCHCKRNSKKYIIIIIVLIIVIIALFFIHKSNMDKDSYKISGVETTNNNFSISGTVIKSNNRTSLIINNVNYTGNDDSTIYKKLKCTLYEEKDNVKTKISTCKNSKNMTLINYLKNIKIVMDHHTSNCEMFTKSDLSIEIVAIDEEDRNITYNIPLVLEKIKCS